MIYATYHRHGKTFVTPVLALVFIALFSVSVSAFEDAANKKVENRASSATNSTMPESETAAAKPLNLSYTPLNSGINFEASGQPETIVTRSLSQAEIDAEQVVKVNFARSIAKINTTTRNSLPMPVPASGEPLKFIPMTVGEKFDYFLKSSILSLGSYGSAAFSGFWGETTDKDHDPNGDHGHYLADVGTRAARSFAHSTTAKFFERFLYPSILRQHPKYVPSYKKGMLDRVVYAASRVIICPGNKGGSQFNASFLGGGLTAAYISKSWEREERKSTGDVFRKWGNHVAIRALTNIVTEFLTGQ